MLPPSNRITSFRSGGEIEAGATRNASTQPLTSGQGTANSGGLLKSQTIIRGNAAGSIFRLFKFTETGASPRYGETFAIFYHSYLQGDFRFSVAQHDDDNNPTTASPFASDAIGSPVRFANVEGLHFRDVEAFIPIGQLYYQALVLNAVGTDGNFSLSLTKIPNEANVFNRFYGLDVGDSRGYETARTAILNWNNPCSGATADIEQCQYYRLSHGYARYGDWYPGSSGVRNSINDTGDGVFFRGCPSCSSFYAFARRPLVIDKRGENYSRQRTQNYQCSSGNSGGCTVDGSGPVFSGSPGDFSRTYPTKRVNLGDARIEGILINQLEAVSCQAGGAAC